MDSATKTQSGNKESRRSKAGCQVCRSKRKKCDEAKPQCQRCVRTGYACHYPSGIRFRPAKVVDGSPVRWHGESIQFEHELRCSTDYTQRNGSDREHATHQSSFTETSPYTNEQYQLSGSSNGFASPHAHHVYATSPYPQDLGQDAYISPQSGPIPDHRMSVICSPDVLTDDGIFLPGSTYQELHRQLRSQIFQTAQSRPCTPRPSVSTPTWQENGAPGMVVVVEQQQQENVSTGSSTPPELTTEQEIVLWDNWVNEIAPWLDKFDQKKHHQHTLPVIAQTVSHLKYSMLALSAKQLERKSGSLPNATSLSLYQWAIHLLLPVLHTRSIPVLASCVVLCVFEMSSCSPKAWRRHLDGCASLIMAMDIRGDQGGLEQSLFWCFARMDVCGGLISSERTLIPVEKWYTDEIAGQGRPPDFEDHASLACWLVARVLHLLNPARSTPHHQPMNDTTFVADWVRLFEELLSWHGNLPAEMQPILSIPSSIDAVKNPFPTVIFSNAAGMSGNQLYHTAVLLMLQQKPRGISVESRSILWHARQICAISMSNRHHGAWINSIQPLWVAGQLMSNPNEHRAIIGLYARIERETGWGATWRAADLQQHWGDLT